MSKKTQIMGILNLTPDSFSDGGKFTDHEAALTHFEFMIKDGADIIDIGAESTKPNIQPLTAEEEWNRLSQFLEILVAKKKLEVRFGAKISIDSYHPETIVKALQTGLVDYINDVNGLKNPKMIEAAKSSKADIIFMHSLVVPSDKNVNISGNEDEIEVLKRYAGDKINELGKHGIALERLVFDIGIGFGKTPKQSYNILKNIELLQGFGVRLMVGHSEKSFLSIFTNKPAGERGLETALFSGYLAAKGVDIIRVHDVALNKRAIKMKDIFLSNRVF